MRVAIATVKVPFIWGGAELQAQGLLTALQQRGVEAELFAVPFKWYPPERILDHILSCRLLDLTESEGKTIDRVIGLKFPAYLIEHPNKVVWLIHQHRQAYELWGDPESGDMEHHPDGFSVRNAIRSADSTLLPRSRAIYAESRTVADRLKHFNQIEAEPLYHPPADPEKFYCGAAGDYLFFPSRILETKRQSLVIEALAITKHPVRVHFAGTANRPEYLLALQRKCADLHVQDRVVWLGSISDEEKRAQYAGCVGVVYPPFKEDYGYVTLEAMLSSKPVVTCSDSGGPLEFIAGGVTGLVAKPALESLADAMDRLWADRGAAARMGVSGRERYESLDISWDKVVAKLLE